MPMLRNTVMNLFSRPATRRYPDEQPKLPSDLRGHVEFDMTKCIFCLMCSKRCPTEAIETSKETKVHRINRNKCIACGTCVESCPVDAITMDPRYQPPDFTPVVDVYMAEHTDHHYTIASLPSFVREPEERPGGVEERSAPLPVSTKGAREAVVTPEVLEYLARDIMVQEVITVREDTRTREVARLMLEHDISGLPVVDIQGRVVGMVTERDLTTDGRTDGLKGFFSKLVPHMDVEVDEERLRLALDDPVSTVMTSPVVTAREDATCNDMARLMNEQNINRIPIVGVDDRLKGIVTRADIIKTLSMSPRSRQQEQMNEVDRHHIQE